MVKMGMHKMDVFVKSVNVYESRVMGMANI